MTASLSGACLVRGQLAFTSTAGLPVSRRHCYSRGNRLRSRLHRPMSRVSSGSIVSDYGLDDREIGVRYPAGTNVFFFVQTGSGAHPDSCTMGPGGPFPRAKARPGRDADH
jgi:hypothetical protein